MLSTLPILLFIQSKPTVSPFLNAFDLCRRRIINPRNWNQFKETAQNRSLLMSPRLGVVLISLNRYKTTPLFFSSHRRRKWTLAKAKNFCRWRRANCWAEKKIKEPVQIFIFWSAGYQKNSRGRCKNKLSPLQSLYCQSHVSCVARLWRMREIFHGLGGSIFRRNEAQFNRVYHVTLRTCVPCKSGTG